MYLRYNLGVDDDTPKSLSVAVDLKVAEVDDMTLNFEMFLQIKICEVSFVLYLIILGLVLLFRW